MMTKLFVALAMLAVAGCVSEDGWKAGDPDDPVVGNWGLEFCYKSKAGHLIASRDTAGNAQALLLWRGGSPVEMDDVTFSGSRFSFVHPWWNMKIEGVVDGGTLKGSTFDANGAAQYAFTGWRNPPIEEACTDAAQFGEPIDLLADGLAGWELFGDNPKFGWSFKNGVLSNRVGKNEDGSWSGGGVNLRTKREDFYDFRLDYDVRVPKGANSGVYLRGRYEIQVIDSFGSKTDCHNMAAYYGRATPLFSAEKPADEWQHVSATLYRRHLTVVLNGIRIIDNAPVVGITGGAVDGNEFVPGFIYLQGDHSDADFKNMILRPCI